MNKNEEVTLDKFIPLLKQHGYCVELEDTIGDFYNGELKVVEFYKPNSDDRVWFDTYNTPEFDKFLDTLEDGTEYKMEYKNHYVSFIKLTSPICNVSGFLDGDKSGITLAHEITDYYTHGFDLFEYCLNLQGKNNLEHELLIMEKHVEHMKWAKDNLSPFLVNSDFDVESSSLFDVISLKDDSTLYIEYQHPNRVGVTIWTDALTGNIKITLDGLDITKIYGKTEYEIRDFFYKEIIPMDEFNLKLGYLTSTDPKETIESYNAVLTFLSDGKYCPQQEINENIIPERYSDKYHEYLNKNH